MKSNSKRILSLDVFRGIIIALMVIVNSLGTRNSYSILEHVEWNGCSLADLVFPSFLFIVGITTVISLKKHRNNESKVELYHGIFKRTIILFLLGLFLNVFPKYIDFSTIRIYGVLQRIALCYLVCAFIYLHTSIKMQIIIFWGIIIGYWYLLTQVPLPGGNLDQLSSTSNWVGYIDKSLLSAKHLYGTFDPEGLLSTLPAIATTLAGLIIGSFLLTEISKSKKSYLIILLGIVFLTLAWLWSYSFPINKNLWTSTFVLWSGGFALILLGVCFYIIDVLRYTKWSLPFKILGMNALFIFVFHVILLKLQSVIIMTMPNGANDNLRIFIAEHLFGHFSQQNAGLFYALLFLLFNFLVALFLYRRKIFIKI